MKNSICSLFILAFVFSFKLNSQIGTISNPFTDLNQAAAVTSPGVYHFNLNGTLFSTFVSSEGYVQVAIDFGNGIGNLPQSTSLTNTSRGILTPSALLSLTGIAEVRMSSTSSIGFDIKTTNATIISRVRNNSTLHKGFLDNSLNTQWTGLNSIMITDAATCNSSVGNQLHQSIAHLCGNALRLHWIPSLSQQKVNNSLGDIADFDNFQLWVKAIPYNLGVELLNFEVQPIENKTVRLDWQTVSETNNSFYTIECSQNGDSWDSIGVLDGANNSSTIKRYTFIDYNPFVGVSYYRIRQTDFDGKFSYSPLRIVNVNSFFSSLVFPNPATNEININGFLCSSCFQICTLQGQDITHSVSFVSKSDNLSTIDISNLHSGMYYLKVNNSINLFQKK